MEDRNTELRKLREEYSIFKEASQHLYAALGELLCSNDAQQWKPEIDMVRQCADAFEHHMEATKEEAAHVKREQEVA